MLETLHEQVDLLRIEITVLTRALSEANRALIEIQERLARQDAARRMAAHRQRLT